jgi:HSP20 family molecular chaperone IbpA
MKTEDEMDLNIEFPERLWKRPIEFHDGKPRLRIAASSYNQRAPYTMFGDETTHSDNEDEQSEKTLTDEPQVMVSTEAGNAKVAVELPSVNRKDLSLHCAEDSLTLSVKTSTGSWIKEVRLPFRVDPDTAKAVFKNGRLELVVRKHGKFNPPRPRLDWV